MGITLRRCLLVAGAAVLSLSACTSAPAGHRQSPTPASPTTSASPTESASSSSVPVPSRTSVHAERSPTRVGPVTTPAPTPRPPASTGLPLAYSTGAATRVITVVAPSTSSTVARLQAFEKVAGGWRAYGQAVSANLGSAGLTSRPSESLSATPIGSFTLTQAFGRDSNPGTALPYTQTTPADWWISQPGPLYNTMQRCAGTCAFTQGDPNEHLFYTTPSYNYAVVIDYNRGPVTQGAGSAFFLHVSTGTPTAGCVSIPQGDLISIMGWLTPATHPRILIGVGH